MLSVALLVALVFVPPINGVLRSGVQAVVDQFDGRPAQRVLFIGNSRTFYNDMPHMVRQMADSAGYGERFDIRVDAQPGVSLSDHWEKPQSHELIAEGWDHVVLQVLSSEQYSADHSGEVWDAATRFIREIDASGARPAMFVTWRYTDQCGAGEGMPPTAVGLSPAGYENMHRNIQLQHARLAETTGVDLVNVGLLWEELQQGGLAFSLYSDCNHPSVLGSYLSALMFYSYFTGEDVADVTFVPNAVTPEHAAFLREKVSAFLGQAAES